MGRDREKGIEMNTREQALEKALRHALGAYEALKIVGADKHLPGYASCLKATKAALAMPSERDPREAALIEAAAGLCRVSKDAMPYLRLAIKAYAAYPEFCLQPELCAGKGYCPRDIACDD